MFRMSFKNSTFTYETRIAPDPILGRIAALCSKQERLLHKHVARGGKLDGAIKRLVIAETGLPGRYYNGISIILDGKHEAVRELTKLQIVEVTERIKQIGKKVERLQADKAKIVADTSAKNAAKRIHKIERAIHGKKRKSAALVLRLARMEAELKAPVPTLCFGSKKLFRKQFALKENGYKDHAEWLTDWRRARSSQFLVPGSHDEPSGNKTCTSFVEADGSVTIRLLVPKALRVDEEKYVTFAGLRFGYGHAEAVAAINAANAARPNIAAFQAETKRQAAELTEAEAEVNSEVDSEANPEDSSEPDPEVLAAKAQALAIKVKALRKVRNKAAKAERAGHTTALTWRFLRDDTGWKVMVSLHRKLEVTDWGFANGAIGVDLNVGFLSIMPVDASGNPLKPLSLDMPIETAALSSDRAKAVLGDVVKALVDMALKQCRPIVIEDLEFVKKKAALKETAGSNLARRLSSFSYNLVKTMIHSRAARFGVRVIDVNPAFTSHMGRAKYVTALGISVHRAAAAMIARRGMDLSEGMSVSGEVPLGDGRHVALPQPVRIGRKHVWASWGRHFGRYKAARKALVVADRVTVRSAKARKAAQVADPASVRCANPPSSKLEQSGS